MPRTPIIMPAAALAVTAQLTVASAPSPAQLTGRPAAATTSSEPRDWAIEVESESAFEGGTPQTTLHAVTTGELAGTSAPLLFLSGGPGFAVDQMMPIADPLRAERPIVMLDQRGTGKSRAEHFDPSQFSFAQAISDLERAREAMAVERWTLVGHSWGGILAMAYACEHPGRVESLVLVCPGGLDPSFMQAYQMNLMTRLDAEAQAELASLAPTSPSMTTYADVIREANRIMAPAMLAEGASDEALAILRANIADESRFNPLVSLAMQRSLMSYDLAPKAAEVDAPVLIVQGREDAIGEDAVNKIDAAFPSTRLEFIEGAGHWPMIETPKKLNEIITEFLAERSVDG